LPESISNLSEIVDKIEIYDLAREVLLPKFDIPDEFDVAQDAVDGGVRGRKCLFETSYHEGANKRYPEITEVIRERLDF
jgi:DNA polymerase-3 subunit alpha